MNQDETYLVNQADAAATQNGGDQTISCMQMDANWKSQQSSEEKRKLNWNRKKMDEEDGGRDARVVRLPDWKGGFGVGWRGECKQTGAEGGSGLIWTKRPTVDDQIYTSAHANQGRERERESDWRMNQRQHAKGHLPEFFDYFDSMFNR